MQWLLDSVSVVDARLGSRLSALAVALGGWLVLWALRKRTCAQLHRVLGMYERELGFLKVGLPKHVLLGAQVVICGVGMAFVLWGRPLAGVAVAGCGVVMPLVWLKRARAVRVVRIEAQLDGWLGALARALEAAPSLGEALEASASMTPAPLGDELDHALAEFRMGRSLGEVFRAMDERVGSSVLSLCLAALEVGLRTGGRLPQILRTTAASLREMARLEGVLRTKTAEGKSQALVISLVPLPLYFGLRFVDPNFFDPLETMQLGRALMGLAVTLWLVAVVLARRILAVQL